MKLLLLFLVYFFVNVQGQRIAGGSTTDISAYPFAASLQTNRGVGTVYTHACGGSILTTRAILSAASCFYTSGVLNEAIWWRARVGSSNSNSGGIIYNVIRITPHPEFSQANDIAVLRTTLPITMQANRIQPGLIAGTAYNLTTNQRVHAIGWGSQSEQNMDTASAELRTVQVFVIDQQTCANRYSFQSFIVHETMVCAGWLDVGIRGQCPGDAGSPLLDENGGIVGVFSWALGCANSWYPDINTRITPYTDWIVSTAHAE